MKMETEFSWNGNENGNSLAEVETEMERRFPVEQMRKRKLPFPTNMEFPFMVVLMANLTGPICDLVILNRQNNPSPTLPLHRVIVIGLGYKFFDFLDFLEFFLHDSSGLLVPTIICFLFVSAPYSFHICFRKYLFSYLFPAFPYSFLLLHKNMKTNVAALSSVRFRSVFIPTISVMTIIFIPLFLSRGR
jgi:hypothetical protein